MLLFLSESPPICLRWRYIERNTYNPVTISPEVTFDRFLQTCRSIVLLMKLVLPSPSMTLGALGHT